MAKKQKRAPNKITKAQLLTMDKAARRQAIIDSGMPLFPKNKVHKSKKTYTRKAKHKK